MGATEGPLTVFSTLGVAIIGEATGGKGTVGVSFGAKALVTASIFAIGARAVPRVRETVASRRLGVDGDG